MGAYPSEGDAMSAAVDALQLAEPHLLAVVTISAHVYDTNVAVPRFVRLDMTTRKMVSSALSEQALVQHGRLSYARVLHYAAQEHYVDEGGDQPLPW